MEEFRIAVAQEDLEDLSERLARTRTAATVGSGGAWAAGTDPGYLAELLAYWRTGFNWRAREAWLNSFPQHTAQVRGRRVHFVRVPGERTPGGPEPLPLILSHGWPYSFAELLPLVPLLTRPGEHGGDAADAFDVVIPSLPGYVFSESLRPQPFTGPEVARCWHELMTGVLGYPGYGTYGEDVGSTVSDWTAALFPEAVVGIFATHAAFPPPGRQDNLTGEEAGFQRWLQARWQGETAYSALQGTKPDTLAAALNDSPAGLAAWLVEKFRTWSEDGTAARSWTADEILTTVSLYWHTRSIGTSFLPYFDHREEPELPEITVPAGVAVQFGERGFPRSYAERTYKDLRQWEQLPRGGHFTAKQTPELVAHAMRTFFRPLRRR